MILTKIIIDLEADELPLRKEVFEVTVKRFKQMPYSQFKLLEKDFLKLKHQFSKLGLDLKNERFDTLRRDVDNCI